MLVKLLSLLQQHLLHGHTTCLIFFFQNIYWGFEYLQNKLFQTKNMNISEVSKLTLKKQTSELQADAKACLLSSLWRLWPLKRSNSTVAIKSHCHTDYLMQIKGNTSSDNKFMVNVKSFHTPNYNDNTNGITLSWGFVFQKVDQLNKQPGQIFCHQTSTNILDPELNNIRLASLKLTCHSHTSLVLQ